jgi:hypothetical protein
MDGSIARSAPVLGKMAEKGERLERGREREREGGRGRKARKESPEEKACLFASDKPAHRNCLLPFSTAFGFPLLVQNENLRDRFSPPRSPLRFSMWQLPVPDPPDGRTDQSRPDRAGL